MGDIKAMEGVFNGFDIIGAGLRAEMQRAEVISVNLSHLQDVGNEANPPYRRHSVVFEEVLKQSTDTLLDGIESVAETQFGGAVERRMVTPVYLGRRAG